MRLFTSHFGNVKALPADLTPVAIATGVPRGWKGRRLNCLNPGWNMLKLARAEYDIAYQALLAKLVPAEIAELLGDGAVMLCWEKPGECCHRRLVAEWLELALDIEVPEHGFARSACLPYAEMPSKATSKKKGSLGATQGELF